MADALRAGDPKMLAQTIQQQVGNGRAEVLRGTILVDGIGIPQAAT
jgi:hypothetical protein